MVDVSVDFVLKRDEPIQADFELEPDVTYTADIMLSSASSFHNELYNRDLPDQHPMSAITGLESAIEGLSEDIIAENNRAIEAEEILDNKIDSETDTRIEEITRVEGLISAEETRAERVEQTKVDKVDSANRVYGTDSQGNQTTYDKGSFGQVDDVQIGGVSVVTDKIAELGTMAGETASNYYTVSEVNTALNGKENTISDLTTIRSNAQDGKTAYTTIQNYGDVVTHNVNEFATAAQGALADTSIQPNDLATVATSGSYNDLSNKPTIGNATLTIQKNGDNVDTFTANATSDKVINITVPTTASDVGALPDTTTINDLTTTAQQNALNSGATSTNIGQIATNTSSINAINDKIPAQASSSNQLADKNFVNSSIATNRANFIGTFANVTALESYVGTVTNNDYAFVINSVVEDNGGDWASFSDLDNYDKSLLTNVDYAWVVNGSNFDLYRFDIVLQSWELRASNIEKSSVTLNRAFNEYKATDNGGVISWEYEYTLNNSSFTATQWAAINSGITSGDVALIQTAIQPSDLATVATSGSYNDLSNKPTIGNATLTIQKNGTTVNTFTANATSNKTINLTVPTATSDLTNDSGFITSADLPTNYVTTNTAQDISAKKTFLGEKAILFKQTATTDKLGFTLYTASNSELGALEYRPNTISGNPLLNLNCSQSGNVWLGFRYWSNINIIAPKPSNGNYYIPVNITDGNTTVTAGSNGTVNISSLLPSSAVWGNIRGDLSNQTDLQNALDEKADVLKVNVADIVSTYADLQSYDTSNVIPNSIIKVIADETNGGKTSWYKWTLSGGSAFTRPNLSANGTIGGNSFACALSSTYQSREAYYAFDGVTTINAQQSNTAHVQNESPAWLEFYNPNPLIVTSITIYNGNTYPIDWQFQCSDDNSSWTTLTSGTNTNSTIGGDWSFNVPDSGSHKYYRFYVTSSNYLHYWSILEMQITATEGGNYSWVKVNEEGKYATEIWVGNQGYLTGIDSSDVTTALGYTPVNPSSLATVATSGSYNDLSNKPTIPTVNNATLTIQKNGTTVNTFTANAISNVTANITVPTNTNELTNGAGFITGISSSDVTTALGYTPANDSNAVHKTGNENIAGIKTFIEQIKATLASYSATSGSTNTKPYKKIGSCVLTGTYQSVAIPFLYSKTTPHTTHGTYEGRVSLRVDGTAGTLSTSTSGIVLSTYPDYIQDGNINFYICYKNNYPESNQVTCEIWVYIGATYQGVNIIPMRVGTGGSAYSTSVMTWGNNLVESETLPDGYSSKIHNVSDVYAKTQTSSDSSTKIATTAFVKAQGYALDSDVVKTTGNQTVGGVKTFSSGINVGDATEYKSQLYKTGGGHLALAINKQDNSGWLSSIMLRKTGEIEISPSTNVTAPTPATSDNSTKIATTAFVNNWVTANTSNVHVVVETYKSGSSWYRIYDDGWIEQGGWKSGFSSANTFENVTLHKPFADTYYNVQVSGGGSATTIYNYKIGNSATNTTTAFKLLASNTGAACFWYACGMGA